MKTTSVNGVRYYHDWENAEGGIVMVQPKTTKRYHELITQQPKSEEYGVFFAFDKEQLEQGRQSLIRRGFMKEGDKICFTDMGMYGTKEEIKRYFAFYDERDRIIKEECDPQEVYFYEWNNHECMISGDDDEALKGIIRIFGAEVAHKIYRLYACTPTNILAPLTERDRHLKEFDHELSMLERLAFDCEGFFSEGDCRYHRPDCLWAKNVHGQVAELRKLYAKLPEDIQDASCVSSNEIEDYARRFAEWSVLEFAKAEYNPVPATPYDVYHGLEIELDKRLYYKDEDGNWQTPHTIWFSNDTRRCQEDERLVHGRAFTSYMGKKGIILTRVYCTNYHTLNYEPYRNSDLCDVTAKYDPSPLHCRLFDFYHE